MCDNNKCTCNTDKYVIKEGDLKIGTFWETDDGQKTLIVKEYGNKNVRVYYCNNESILTLSPTGTGSARHGWNLKKPWVEPKKLTFFMNIYEDASTMYRSIKHGNTVYKTEKECKEATYRNGYPDKLLDTIQINYVEGKKVYS